MLTHDELKAAHGTKRSPRVMRMNNIEAGEIFSHPYPFFRCKTVDYSKLDIPNQPKTESWRPGTYWKQDANGEADCLADGVGERIFEIVSIHKPGKYPTRVFYLQRWKDPDGKEFERKRNPLRITSVGNFRVMLKGYRYSYDVENG